jgi:hypothetical protein
MTDRTVSFDVLAVDKASRALADVGREVETLARKIDSADGDIRVDADTAAAREKLAQIDSQLARLNAKSFRVDAETAKAQRDLQILEAELRKTTDEDRRVRIDGDITAIQAKLRQLAAEKVAVDVETAGAQAKLRRLQDDLRPQDPKPAKIDVDVAGALANIGRFTAALAAIPAVVTVAVGAVGVLGGAGAALGLGLGAGVAGTQGLGDAVKALGEKSTAAGGAATSSASAIRAANQAVVDARRDLVRANEAVGDAEQDLARAQEEAKRAQDSLTDARREASRELEDYQLRAAGMALSEESAALSVAEAQDRLKRVNEDAKSTSLERARAELNVREALQRQNELSVEAKRLTEDKTAADAKGVEGSSQVVAAQDRIRAANDGVVQAQRNLQRAHEDVTRATEQVAEAILRLHEAAAPKGGGGGGVDKLADAMNNLGPRGQQAALMLDRLTKGPLKDLREAGQEQFLRGIIDGLTAVEQKIPTITPRWAEFSSVVGDATGNLMAMGAELAGPFLSYASASMQGLQPLQGVLQDLEQELAATFERMASTGEAENAMRAVVDVIGALVPAIPPLVEGGAQIMTALGPGLSAVVRELSQGLTDAIPSMVAIAGSMSQLLSAVAPIAPELAAGIGAFMLFKRMGGELSPVLDTVRGAYDRLRGSARDAGQELDLSGRNAQTAEGHMTGLGAGLNRVGLALVASQTAAAAFGSSAAVGVDTATRALESYAVTGQMSSTVTRSLGDDLRSLDDEEWYNGLAKGVISVEESLTGLGSVFDDSLQHKTERLQSLDAALAQMVTSGHADQAAEAWKRITAEADSQNVSMDRLTQGFPAYQNALDGSARSADSADQSLKRLNQTQQEAATAFMSTEQANLRYEQAVGRLTQSIETNGNTINIHTEKGRANREAILGMINAANDNIDAMTRSGAASGTVSIAFMNQREELIKVATQLIGSRDKAQEFIDKMLKIPNPAKASVQLDTSQAEAALATWAANLSAVQANAGKPYALGYFARSAGGWVPGAPSRVDTVPARLAGGEFVVQSSAASEWGPLLEQINSGASPSELAISAGSTPLVPGQRAGGSGGTVVNNYFSVQVSGVVGDHSEVVRRIGVGLKESIDRGELPRDLFAPPR